MFVYKKNPEKLGPTFTKNCEANFIDMSLVIFSHESLLEYEKILQKKHVQTLQCILPEDSFEFETFFWCIYGIQNWLVNCVPKRDVETI